MHPSATDDYLTECARRNVSPGGKPGPRLDGRPAGGRRPLRLASINVSSFDPDVRYVTMSISRSFGRFADQTANILEKNRLYHEMQVRAQQLATAERSRPHHHVHPGNCARRST